MEDQKPPYADKRKTFDVETMVATEFGGRVKDVNPDGTLQITIVNDKGQEVEKKFDLPKMMVDQGIDASKVNIVYNSPDTAADPQDLSFGTRLQLSLAEDPKSQMKVLAEELGEDNVKITPNGVVVKERGVWKKADSDLLSDLTSSLPEMAGGLAGRAAGAKVGAMAGAAAGSVVPVVGTAAGGVIGAVVGGIFGGGVGSAAAKVIKDKGAEAVGIKTEYDADQAKEVFGKELAWNMAIDTTLGAAGLAWRGIGKPVVKAAGKAMKGNVKALIEGGDKSLTAQTLETLVPGTNRNDWITVMRSPRDATKVLTDMNQYHAWDKARASSILTDAVDPLTNKMTGLAQTAMKHAKQRAMNNYGKAMDVLEKSGATASAEVNLNQVAGQFQSTLNNLGLLFQETDGAWKVIRRVRPGPEEIMQVFDPKSINTLGKVFDQLNAVLPKGQASAHKPISFTDTKKLLNGIDDILESSGVYKNGDAAMSNNARRALIKLRRDVNEAMIASLPNHRFTLKSGEVVTAASHYRQAAKRYSDFRELYDDFALPGTLGGSDQRAASTINTMLGEKGANIEKNFMQMLRLADASPEAVVSRMQQLRASKNLADAYSSSTGLGAVVKGKIGVQNPSAIAKTMAEHTVKAGKKALPLSSQSKTQVEAMAKGYDWLSKLSHIDKMNLISNPVLIREFGEAVLNAPLTQARTQEALMNGEVGP